MKHVVEHDLGQERAKEVAVKALESYAAKFQDYSPRTNWTSPSHADISFKVKGVTLKGAIDVTPTAIELDLDVPFIFRPFKGTALGYIEQAISRWIEKAKQGKL